MKKWILRIVIFVFAAILFCGCTKESLNPQIPYGLLIKCRDFLSFCIFLADQEKPYYNHIAQRYYYAMLALASITYQWNKGHGVEYKVIKHEEVWRLMPHDVKELFGVDLKGLRTRCDYNYEETARDMDGFRKELLAIISKNDRVFQQLENKVRFDYVKFLGKNGTDKYIKQADLDTLMKEIKGLQENFASMLDDAIVN